MKVIDLDSWETGYADGELGRATQCPIGCDCEPLSYSIGYRAGREVLAQERVERPHDSAMRNCQSSFVDLDRGRVFPLPAALGDPSYPGAAINPKGMLK